jgi:hypothetical protein
MFLPQRHNRPLHIDIDKNGQSLDQIKKCVFRGQPILVHGILVPQRQNLAVLNIGKSDPVLIQCLIKSLEDVVFGVGLLLGLGEGQREEVLERGLGVGPDVAALDGRR